MLTEKLVYSYHQWFNDYVGHFIEKYPSLSANIKIKAGHCLNVSVEITDIAKGLGLGNNDILLAETIGLFHDLGRFKQYVKYGTFSDSNSQNHAQIGVDVLKEHNILKGLPEETKEIIFMAILNHNKATISEGLNKRGLFFSKLIRDADKLDIWRLITEYYLVKSSNENKTLVLDLPDNGGISEGVMDDFLNKGLVLKESLRNENDFKMLQIAWIFDLNFSCALKKLHEKKYLEKIMETLPQQGNLEKIRQKVDDYFDKVLVTKGLIIGSDSMPLKSSCSCGLCH